MTANEFDLPAGRHAVRGTDWMPEDGLRAGVAIVHGQAEHVGRYDHFADVLNGRGFGVLGADHVGHGRSPGKRGHARDIEDYLATPRALVAEWRRRHGNLPLFLFGQSMGGTITAHYVLREKPDLAGAVLSSSWFRLAFDPPAVKVKLAGLVKGIWPGFSEPNGLDANELSRDPVVAEDYRRDPLVHGRITAGAFFALHTAAAWNLEHAAELTMPVLVMHGSADRITSCTASRAFAEKAGPRATFREWPEHRHELHNELDRGEVLRTIIDWMDGVLAGRPA
jgi:alpha-beta hydrolase superfamily lysophospholipase